MEAWLQIGVSAMVVIGVAIGAGFIKWMSAVNRSLGAITATLKALSEKIDALDHGPLWQRLNKHEEWLQDHDRAIVKLQADLNS